MFHNKPLTFISFLRVDDIQSKFPDQTQAFQNSNVFPPTPFTMRNLTDLLKPKCFKYSEVWSLKEIKEG